MTDKQIVAKARRRAKTSGDLGVSINRLRRLEREGALRAVGTRETGTVGRPPVEFIAV